MRMLRWFNVLCLCGLFGCTVATMLIPYRLPDSLQMVPAHVTPRAWLMKTVSIRQQFTKQTGQLAGKTIVHAWTLAAFDVEGCYREARAPFVIVCIRNGQVHAMSIARYGFMGCAVFALGSLLSSLGWQWGMQRHYRRHTPAGYCPPRWAVWPLKRAHPLHGALPYWPVMRRGQRALMLLQWGVLVGVSLAFYVYNLRMQEAAG